MGLLQSLVAFAGLACFVFVGITNVRTYVDSEISFHALSEAIPLEVRDSGKSLEVRLYLDRTYSINPGDYALANQINLSLSKDGVIIPLSRGWMKGQGSDSYGAFVSVGTFKKLDAGTYSLHVNAPQEFYEKNYKLALTDKRVIALFAGIFSLVFPAIAFIFQILSRIG